MLRDAYQAVGLLGNPFVAEQVPGVAPGAWLDMGVADPPPRGVVELVGVRGAGKTSHLLRWTAARGGRYHYVELGRRAWRPLPLDGPVLAWDEVDRLPAWRLARAVAAVRRRGDVLLLLGTHVPTGLADVSHRLAWPTPASVRRFFDRRVGAAVMPGHPVPSLPLGDEDTAAIAATSEGCWWNVGTALHVHVAKLVTDRPEVLAP